MSKKLFPAGVSRMTEIADAISELAQKKLNKKFSPEVEKKKPVIDITEQS